MHKRTRRRKIRKIEVNQELELMPMLNVFISIIPLLLLSAAFVQLAVIPTALPASATAPAAPSQEDATLAVTIVIHPDAYAVEANGAVTSTIARAARPRAAGTVDVARAELHDVLAAIAAQHPDHRTVRIVADPDTHYEDIIDVMDTSRSAGLPDAALADADGAQGGD